MSKYLKFLISDPKKTRRYYQNSIKDKTEHQKYAEFLLKKRHPKIIADIASGSGGASFYFSKIWKRGKFSLLDINLEALSLAKKNFGKFPVELKEGSIYKMPFKNSYFDMVLCFQTLSWLEDPYTALKELVRICKNGGEIVVTSLFNLDHDVDIWSEILDHTRTNGKKRWFCNYNTFSKKTILNWLKRIKVKSVKILPIPMNKTLRLTTRGLGTYTKKIKGGGCIQISGGLLMNWGILLIKK